MIDHFREDGSPREEFLDCLTGFGSQLSLVKRAFHVFYRESGDRRGMAASTTTMRWRPTSFRQPRNDRTSAAITRKSSQSGVRFAPSMLRNSGTNLEQRGKTNFYIDL